MLRNASAVYLVDEINIFGSRFSSSHVTVQVGPERIRKLVADWPVAGCPAPYNIQFPFLFHINSLIQHVS